MYNIMMFSSSQRATYMYDLNLAPRLELHEVVALSTHDRCTSNLPSDDSKPL